MDSSTFVPPRHIVAVSALVSNPAGDILLVKTDKRGWEIPGGQVELGETLTDAVRRETQEESGLTITLGPLGTVQSNLTRNLVIFGFLAAYQSGELTTSAETSDVAWVARDEALARITHPAIADRVRFLLAYDGRVVYHSYRLDPYVVVGIQAV